MPPHHWAPPSRGASLLSVGLSQLGPLCALFAARAFLPVVVPLAMGLSSPLHIELGKGRLDFLG